MVTSTKTAAKEILPLAGADNSKRRLGFVDSVFKSAQNDTVTITNASKVLFAIATTDADGVNDPVTLATNVITLTGTTATTASIVCIYQ